MTNNNLHNNHLLYLPIITHRPGNRDQQIYPRDLHTLHAFRLRFHPLIHKIILFSILHLDALLVFILSLFCVGVWIAADVFFRAVDMISTFDAHARGKMDG